MLRSVVLVLVKNPGRERPNLEILARLPVLNSVC